MDEFLVRAMNAAHAARRAAARGYADGGDVPLERDEDTYGPTNLDERRARVDAFTGDIGREYPGDKLDAPQGYISPAMAAQWKQSDAGPYSVDAEGKELPLIRQPGVLPVYRDPTIDRVRFSSPAMMDIAGNATGAPAGVTAVNMARAVLKGERPAANVVSAMGGADKAAAYDRQLSPLGFYSHGAEAAAALPQAKGTPEQFAAMLQKAGVKPTEMEGYADAFAGRPSVTRDDVARHFAQRMPRIEETTLGGNRVRGINDAAIEQHLAPLREVGIHPEVNPESLGDVAFLHPEGDLLMASEFRGDPEIGHLHNHARAIEDYYSKNASNAPLPKFQEYTLPGGENYREVLLKTPTIPSTKFDDFLSAYRKRFPNSDVPDSEVRGYWSRGVQIPGMDKFKTKPDANVFRSSHWDDPNVVAHLRMADRAGPNGEKVLHVEEIQSDWGQQGRENGFAEAKPWFRYTNKRSGNSSPEFPTQDLLEKHANAYPESLRRELVLERGVRQGDGVPTGPYVTNTSAWTDLALKRALKEAATGGYDRLAWTPGAEQASRYDLSKQIGRVQYNPRSQSFRAYDLSENPVIEKAHVKPDKIADYIGKEPAQRLLAPEAIGKGSPVPIHELRGLDLQVGGEGMKSYYDKIIPKRLHDIARRHDPSAKIEPHDIIADKKIIPSQSLAITPKMRESIMRGQPAYNRGGGVDVSKAVLAAARATKRKS